MALTKLCDYLAARSIHAKAFRDQLSPLALKLCVNVLTKEMTR